MRRTDITFCSAALCAMLLINLTPIFGSHPAVKFIFYLISYTVPVVLVKATGKNQTAVPEDTAHTGLTRTSIYLIWCCFISMLTVSSVLSALTHEPAASYTLTPYTFILSGITVPILEELFWRRTVYRTLAPHGTLQAMIISSVLFGLLHPGTAGLVYAVFSGMLFSYLYFKTRTLLSCIVLHMTNNITALISSVVPQAPLLVCALLTLAAVIAKITDKRENRPNGSVFYPMTDVILRSPYFYLTVFIFVILRIWG